MAKKIAFIASETRQAKSAAKRLTKLYGNHQPENCDVIVALGGDGFMLQALHQFMNTGLSIYGMNKGTVGFLMNGYREKDLPQRLDAAEKNTIRPLTMIAEDESGKSHKAKAINEVSLLRQSYQAASLRLSVDSKEQMDALICDGLLVATPAGSTAYNLSAHGPILPLNAPLLALTPVSPFRPRRWRGALLPNSSKIVIDINNPGKRPVNAVADHTEIKSVTKVTVSMDNRSKSFILFDREHSWDDRILAEQFLY